VLLKNSGVARFDDFTFKMATAGWNTGPKPPPGHMPTWMTNNWAYYTLRLPMVIDGTNDTIFSGATSGAYTVEYNIPHGTYYLSEITDLIGAAFWNFEADVTLQLGRYNGDNLSLIFGDGIIEFLNEEFTNALTFISFPGLTVYGPDNFHFLPWADCLWTRSFNLQVQLLWTIWSRYWIAFWCFPAV
jgi:hypothetical protein